MESILAQSFRDFEFLVIDDGSTDDSVAIVKQFEDDRIKLFCNQQRLGVSATLNKGLALAKSPYIARMDADDISTPERLQKQRELLERTPEIGACGSWVRMFADGSRGHIIRYPLDAATIRAYILFNNPLAHPAAMMRRHLLQKYDLSYDQKCGAGQDYELWSRCLHHFPLRNIGQPLLQWRVNQQGVTQQDSAGSNQTALLIQRRELARLGLDVTEESLLRHRAIGRGDGASSLTDIESSRQWIEKVVAANLKAQYYPQHGLQRAAAMIWFRYCMNSHQLGRVGMGYRKKVSFFAQYQPDVFELLVFFYNYFFKKRK